MSDVSVPPEPGFYWVKEDPWSKPFVAEWLDEYGGWEIPGSMSILRLHDVVILSERLEPPEPELPA